LLVVGEDTNNGGNFKPKFFINERIRKNDRLLRIHFLSNPKGKVDTGLNAFGVESLGFQYNPSCFALKINNLLTVNSSNDFIVSKGLGFPYPETITFQSNENILLLSNWNYTRKIESPIAGITLKKSSLSIYQPIHFGVETGSNFHSDSYFIFNCRNYSKKEGLLFYEKGLDVISLENPKSIFEYQEVKGNEVSRIGELISEVYILQKFFTERIVNASENGAYNFSLKEWEMKIDFFKNYHLR